jgi:hypothetical protein
MKGGEIDGMIPLNWHFAKDSSGRINQEKAVQELNNRISELNKRD